MHPNNELVGDYWAIWRFARNSPIFVLRAWMDTHTDTWASVTIGGYSVLVGDVRTAVKQILADADRGIAQIPLP